MVSGSPEEAWAEERLRSLDGLGVDALVTTGEVCAPLRQVIKSYQVQVIYGTMAAVFKYNFREGALV